jgi:hypothetical protein
MALNNTLNFLPDVFRSVTNQRFLGATLDQLTTDAINVPINGYIGRTFAPTYKLGDNYISELTAQRKNYQLEPSVVIKSDNGDIVLNSEYIDLLQSIDNNRGFSNDHRRLFSSTYYNFDGKFNYDKFVNYNNYYWLPNGPASVAVTASATPLQADYTVTRNIAVNGYTFSGQGSHPNQQITLTRGGTYNFTINQPGFKFWIQSKPGVGGVDPGITNLTTRNVFGVTNNGTDNGVIQFDVPLSTSQDFYNQMPIVQSVTAAATFNYSDIQNVLLSDFLTAFPHGLDGITNQLQNKTFIFVNNETDNAKWEANGDSNSIVPVALRNSVWQIKLTPTGSDYTIQVIPTTSVATHEKVFITSGKTYASNEFWLNNNYQYITVPPITATLDYLYYQDSSNPGFVGEIKLVDNTSTPINVNTDIIGKNGYTSPTGVIFTNGLKIKFDSLVNPVEYANNEYYVGGVGTGISLVPVTELVVPEPFGANIATTPDYITINRVSQDRNPWSRSNRWFHKDVLTATAKYNQTIVDYGPNIYGRRAILEFDADLQLFNFSKKNKHSVNLLCFNLPATQIITGGTYTIVSVGTTDFTTFGATANTVGTTFIATRSGVVADGTGTTSTDAFVQIEGPQTTPPKAVDGVTLTQGMRVVFANDYDLAIENKVWSVDFETINSEVFVRLIETADDPVIAGEGVTVTQGNTNGAQTFWFNGENWNTSQAKLTVQQAPLFDLVDASGYSFGDTTMYPNSTFTGTKFFGYPIVVGTNDPVLGFPLKYQNFNNIGDIVFANYYDTDTFTYTSDTNTGATSTVECNSGYAVYNTGLTSSTKVTNWIPGLEKSDQYQLITKFYEGFVLDINGINYPFVQVDILPDSTATIPHLKVYLNNKLLNSNTDYQLVPYGVYYVITLNVTVANGDKIDIAILSKTTSTLGYYEIPKNLDYNPLNKNFLTITLGQLRTHYNKLLENTTVSLTTPVPVQDQFVKAQGGTLVQHSSPLIYAMTFLTDPVVNYINGITLARDEYTRFKNKFLSLCTTLKGLDYNNPMTGVDTILQAINSVKNSSFPWYYSDMVPQGSNYTTTTYTVLNARQTNYEISSIFDITKLSNRAVLVYHNGVQLTGDGIQFSYNALAPEVIIRVPLAVGDKIMIRDYFNTDGNWIPETPVKLGLQQDQPPELFLDDSYVTPTYAIRGHDGSITPAFGDFRDDYLLELEKRIYNNVKVPTDADAAGIFDLHNTKPGRFRATGYSLSEWDQLLTTNFLQWVGSNNIDYTTNKWFDANNPWTWNYGQSKDSVDGSALQGSWRAIYNHWYDTDEPHRRPWCMLGLEGKPYWWDKRYGLAPYTKGNTTLWDDLEAGYVWNSGNAYIDTRFARPGLSKIIPVDSAGNLLDPTQTGIIKQLDTRTIGSSFSVGNQGPVETAWRRSSDYSFAVQQALAIARPADYFSAQLDISRFRINEVTGQFSDTANRRISPDLLTVNGDTTTVPGAIQRTAGYLNWIADYIKNLGIDPVAKIENYFKNFNVQLAYRVAGFTDQKLITVTAEQTSPGSTNASVIIPDGNYSVYLNKSVPTKTISYSAVIVTKVDGGYSVSGYDTSYPYFTILPSIANSNSTPLTVNDITVNLYKNSSQEPTVVPYGTTFTSVQQVSDFLISYQRYLVNQGFTFSQADSDLQQTRDWILSINEFLFWAQQGFNAGVLIVLNPVKDTLDVITKGTVIDAITNLPNGSRLMDTNFKPISSNNFNVLRVDYPTGNRFQVTTVNGLSTIAFAKLDLIQYESTLIFDNVDTFGDIIYIPEQGTRQFRLKVTGAKTGIWDGALSATGYIYSNPVISAWQPGVDYKQGDIITFNNSYYTAPNNIVARQTFNPIDWKLISLADLQTGLLPSFGHNAQIFENIYNIDVPPQDENFQTFSAGLIGFRERPFLSNLGISVPTQTKFYQGYIHQKGTQNAITSLTKATFDAINSTVGVYEEWAFEAGRYGALDTNQYTEFVLDQSIFTTNPVAFTSNTVHSTGNIIVNLNGNATSHFDGNLVSNSDVYNSSNIASTSTTLYNNRITSNYPADLPSCGYVNLADVDYQIFDISAMTVMPTLTTNSKIWVAKDFNPGWNVYRVTDSGLTATTLTYTMDVTAQLTFNSAHSFSVGDYFVLQNFNSAFNGLYQVKTIINATSVSIIVPSVTALVQAGGNVTGLGTVYTLKSMVINSYSQIASITPTAGWVNGDRVWINADTQPGATGWGVYTYNGASWTRTRQQSSSVDITSINRTFIYNKSNNVILAALDYIDPAKGKILNTVGSDIDYQLTQDPALYNNGNVKLHTNLTLHSDYHWGPQQVGKIWWDLNAVRYINYEQDALIYRLNHWGEAFPGSEILVYEWVESNVLPSRYVAGGGSGIPLHADDSAYSTYGSVGPTGTVNTTYYFWVANKTTINQAAGKVNSVYSIATAISNPQAQGTPYAMVLRDDTVALFNVNSALTGKNSVIHLGSRSTTAGLIHSEYALIQEGNPLSQLPQVVERKLIDSLVGQDSAGNPVPDPALTPAQAYGISIRPRQSMFVDRALALTNYLTLVNSKLLSYPVIERKILTTLNSQDPVPAVDSGMFDTMVNTRAELDYVDTTLISSGYKILVNTDVTQSNKWAIYNWDGTTWVMYQVQSYKTNLYWNTVDWYMAGYDHTTPPNITVGTRLDFGKLTLVANTFIKVLNNGNNQFEVYYIDGNLTQNLVGLQNGTLQISTGTIPALELRQIATAMQYDIFIEDLALDYNQIFFTMIKYALSEQKNIEWVFKTSFLSATQYIRSLTQFPSYIADNQSYYLDYINEVKPYRTTVREFVVDYQGLDTFQGNVTDFDLPPYWDANLQIYRSPNGSQPYDTALLTSGLYNQWNNNYKYCVVDVIVEHAGTGYTLAPQVIITGGSGLGATAYATLNGTGGIGSIIITNPGKNYISEPDIIINGTGTGATARPVLRNVFDGNNQGHNVVRSINTTITFDRINYTNPNTFVFWNSITSANIGQTIPTSTIIVLDNNFYQLANAYTIDASVEFPIANVVQISSNFNNANDRIVAYNGNVDLRLTQKGLEYPGVIVDGNTFIGGSYDALIQSRYTDVLGISPNNIFVDGGKYVDIFESYAPEELVPGRMYDNLNLTVIDTDFLGFRLYEDMNHNYNSYRIAGANTTVLTSNLALTDTSILVSNASQLPLPDTKNNIPGVVFINGERITYWRNYALESKTPWGSNTIITTNSLITNSGNTYLTTGNVYGAYFANIASNVQQVNINTLAQIRRATEGTSAQLIHAIGSQVVDSSRQQIIPGSANSNVVISTSTTYTTTDVISLGIQLTGNVSGNIGDTITQVETVGNWIANTNFALSSLVYYSGNSYTVTGNVYGATFASISSNVALIFAGNTNTISTMTLLQTVSNVSLIPVILVSGTIQGSPVQYDSGVNPGDVGTYDDHSADPEGINYTGGGTGFDNIVGSVHVNGNDAAIYVVNSYILGEVNSTGQVTITTGNVLSQSNVWYSPGPGTITNGLPLVNSTTIEANFLKASKVV